MHFLPYLNTVVARRDPAVLDLDVVRGVRELAVPVRPGALLPLELAAHLELQPPAFVRMETDRLVGETSRKSK